MPLTNFVIDDDPKADDVIVIKADDGKERINQEIPRTCIEDCFPDGSDTHLKRVALLKTQINAITLIMNRKYANNDWQTVMRASSPVRLLGEMTSSELWEELSR